jgi:hypothetical protein
MSYNIFDAVKDLATGELKIADENLANERLAECNICDARALGVCTACGCIIAAKVRLLESDCPLGLW